MLEISKGPVPHSFGMAWTDQGVHGRYGHRLRLWTAEGDVGAFHDAYRAEKALMVDAGYSWRRMGLEDGMTPCFWVLSEPAWSDEIATRIEAAIHAAAAKRDESRLRSQERLADEVARVAISSAPIRADLDALLAERPWAFRKKLPEAEELAAIAIGDWTAYGAACAGALVDDARRAILRAEERLARPAPAAWWERAADPAVRAAVLVACKVLSDRDSDRASIRNGRGWSQATSWTGHVVAGRAALSQAEAAHGMAILWGHRSQLPAVLREEVFFRSAEASPGFMHP